MLEQSSVNPAATSDSSLCRTFGLSWPVLVALFAFAGVIYNKGLNEWLLFDADTYWHLAAGRWIIEHGTVPTSDPFSHSMPQAPWTAHEWLSEVVLALVHEVAGWGGLGVLTAAIFALTLACMLRFLLARMEPVHALMVTVVVAAMMLGHMLARPHVLVWPLLAVWVGSLTNSGEKGDGPPWRLLPLMTLWANLHGSFVLGLVLAGALALDALLQSPRTLRRGAAIRWTAFVAMAALASAITPWGLHGLWYPLELTSMNVALRVIGEWRPPNFQMWHPLELWLLIVIALACAGRMRLPWLRLILVLVLVHLALKHHRHVAVLGLVSPFLIATPFGMQLRATRGKAADVESLDRVFAALAAPAKPLGRVVVMVLGILIGADAVWSQRFAPAVQKTPEAAVHAAFAAGAGGPVFNSYDFGGYLVYKGVPVFIDGRADMYGDALLKRYMEAVHLADSEKLPHILSDYRIGWTLFEPGTPALVLLDRLPGWRRVYEDAVAVVHVYEGARQTEP